MNRPPKIARHLLKWFCRSDYLEEVAGDLQEVYEWRLENSGRSKARFWYLLDVFSAIRFYKVTTRFQFISNAMFFSFIKSSFRNFKRHLAYTALNVSGLALGLAASLFILEYVSEELNYNHSQGSERLYRVSNDYYRYGDMIYESCLTFSGVGPAMVRDLPGVSESARLFDPGNDVVITRPDKPHIRYKEENLFFAEAAYFDFFDLTITHGLNDLEKPNTVVVSAEMAEKYFAGEDPIGKTLKYRGKRVGFS